MSIIRLLLIKGFICFSVLAFSVGKTFTVTNTNVTGAGSIGAAIDSVNANPTNANNKHKIVFSSTIPSPYTIVLNGSLQLIKEPVIIDGKINSSQNIIIHGNGTNILGIRIGADYCEVKNIYLKRFDGGAGAKGINIDSSYANIDSCKIDSCFRAIQVGGNYAVIKHSKFYRITGGGQGIYISGDYAQVTDGNSILNTDKTATGVNITSTADYTVIGREILQGDQMNVIGGFYYGIENLGSNTKIYGNLIGGPSKLSSTNCSGADYGSSNIIGIHSLNGNGRAEIGKLNQSNDHYANIFLGNTSAGVYLQESDKNIISGNYFGVDKYTCLPTGTIYNTGTSNYGVNISSGADSNIVGSYKSTLYNEFDGNILSNLYFGVVFAGGYGNEINGNFIGTDRNNRTGIGNRHSGIYTNATSSTMVRRIDGNLISGNTSDGIYNGARAIITNNKIGTTKDGRGILGNGNYGIDFVNSGGKGSIVQNNLISANRLSGIYIVVDSILIIGNKLGTNIDGDVLSTAVQSSGIRFHSGKGTIIGGRNASERNIISGNGTGILIESSTGSNKIIGNYIGVNANATVPVYNTNLGAVYTYANRTIVGGNNLSGEGNIIVGPTSLIGADSCIIKGNYIGTNKVDLDMGQVNSGVWVYNGATNNIIGSTIPGEGNRIAFTKADGIRVENTSGQTTNNNKISGNSIYKNTLKAINLNYANSTTKGNDGKPIPTIDTVKYYTPTQVIFKGSAQAGDSIEVFSGESTGKNAYGYVGHGLTDGSGKWTITANVDTLSRYYVATATNSSNNTSELSAKKTGSCYYFNVDTRNVYPAGYDVLQGASSLRTNLTSGPSGTGNGQVYINPVVPSSSSTVNLKIKENTYNDSLRVYLDIDKYLNISNLKGKIESNSPSLLSSDHYTIDTSNVGCDAITFYSEPHNALPVNITTNLYNGIIAGTSFEVYGLTGLQAELKVYQVGNGSPLSTLTNGTSDKISYNSIPSIGLYKFILKLTDGTTPSPRILYYKGEFVKH